jgi:3-oxoisoapionate decarboxylase
MNVLFEGLGIAATSFGGALYGPQKRPKNGDGPAGPGLNEAQQRAATIIPVVPGAPGARHADTLEFLNRCHSLGAAGIQAHINGDLRKLRARAEELGMWMEGMVSVCGSTAEEFEAAIVQAKEAGCTVARDAMLSGRRYERFGSLGEWKDWVVQSYRILQSALPVLEKHRFTLALENHKDWLAKEYVTLFEHFSSEYLGACLDLGNNLALLEDPDQVIEAAAPYVKSTHVKDMAVEPSEEGFEMAEVPFGAGVLDLAKAASSLRKANPAVRFALEMITRDPLPIPCLDNEFWATFPERKAAHLRSALDFVQRKKSAVPLPRVNQLSANERTALEVENIRSCFERNSAA